MLSKIKETNQIHSNNNEKGLKLLIKKQGSSGILIKVKFKKCENVTSKVIMASIC